MINYCTGNLIESDAEALVNTVNTKGVMGKGIALQFKQAFPENFNLYERAVRAEEVRPGKMFVVEMIFGPPRFIINFPTKRHWLHKSRIDDIELGLRDLVEVVRSRGIKSIAVPPLGCGNGGLDWRQVRPLIEHAMAGLEDVDVRVFEPQGAPEASKMMVAPKERRMTPGRAAVIGLIERFASASKHPTKLEIQKLAYFLQVAGEPLRLNFQKNAMGPYARNLEHVLRSMDGMYLSGFGDGTGRSEITLDAGAADEARSFLDSCPDTRARFERVAQLIGGYERPKDLELLSTVHWVMSSNPELAEDPAEVVRCVQSWSDRKRRSYSPQMIEKTWSHLLAQGWQGNETDQTESKKRRVSA